MTIAPVNDGIAPAVAAFAGIEMLRCSGRNVEVTRLVANEPEFGIRICRGFEAISWMPLFGGASLSDQLCRETETG
jgi:hypothetical protein